MGTNRVEFWPMPTSRLFTDKDIVEQFRDAYNRVRANHPKAKLHVVVEVRDKYRALRSKLAKRAAQKRKKSNEKHRKKEKSSLKGGEEKKTYVHLHRTDTVLADERGYPNPFRVLEDD